MTNGYSLSCQFHKKCSMKMTQDDIRIDIKKMFIRNYSFKKNNLVWD